MAAPLAALVSACLLALAAPPARANPLTEVPGRPAAPAAEAPPPRDAAEEAGEARAENPSATAILRALAPFADGNPGAPPGAPARPLAVSPADGGPPVRVDAARTVDLTVFFPYDSARLTPEARVQLEPLGEALSAGRLARHGFLIAGHTDAAGGPLYNRRLSLARARAVKAHLVAAYGIDPARLRVHGWGADRLKDPGAPLARVNRRVEVSLIAPRGAALGPRRDPRPAPPSFAGTAFAETAFADGPFADPPCFRPGRADPRLRVALDLDDFDAAPTPVACAD
ncbi:OmpA family protein [Methylobacterium sp. NEAU 140]|uniref:OmpA family protein n=1 Tax=Methylobacterium sp. NEAU 140 TaxID=3064945 RepID=UPI002735746D|nr:OmpA family protein [Methylobacterium sp. NEAU 140]MDP4022883.1 OmpA family protein [Methylobacterium sp. NEAU 140]